MSERKPDVFTVSRAVFDNATPDYLPDDVLYVAHTNRYRFASDSPLIDYSQHGFDLIFHHTRTDRIGDPIDYFSKVLASGVKSRMFLNPSRASTIARFPQINPLWYRAHVNFDRGTVSGHACVEFCANTGSHNDPTSTVYRQWAWGSGYSVGNLVVSRCSDRDMFAACQLIRPGADELEFTVDKSQPPIPVTLFVRPYVLLQHLSETLFKDAPFKRLLPPDQAYLKSNEAISDSRIGFVETAPLRLPFYLDRVFGVVLGLEQLGLPPYVVLEIVDWLPKMELWPHGKKIAVIMKAQSSMRRIKEARGSTIKEPKLE